MVPAYAVSLTARESWALIHGVVLGALFLLAFAGGLAGLWSLRPELLTKAGITERTRRVMIGVTAMAVLAWLTVITGTWIVYPWYREDVPTSPRSVLKADPDLAGWHEFWFEWKEHIAWLSPFLATTAAFVVVYYKTDLIRNNTARRIAIGFLSAAFVVAAIAGLIGALVTKKASV